MLKFKRRRRRRPSRSSRDAELFCWFPSGFLICLGFISKMWNSQSEALVGKPALETDKPKQNVILKFSFLTHVGHQQAEGHHKVLIAKKFMRCLSPAELNVQQANCVGGSSGHHMNWLEFVRQLHPACSSAAQQAERQRLRGTHHSDGVFLLMCNAI